MTALLPRRVRQVLRDCSKTAVAHASMDDAGLAKRASVDDSGQGLIVEGAQAMAPTGGPLGCTGSAADWCEHLQDGWEVEHVALQ